jgi:hypothetical protein
MSDVILYAAVKENQRLLQDYVFSAINPGAPLSIDWFANNNLAPLYNCYGRTINTQCPPMVQYWQRYLTPFTAPRANGIKVCDDSGNFRCDRACLFTVPAGVTQVQFQLWGAGGGNSSQCCCGGAPFGPTGSYAVANVTVTPGETFCLVTACAYCCWATQTTPGVSTQCTCVWSVTNPNFLLQARGAIPDYNCWCNANPTTAWSQCGPLTNLGCNPSSCSGYNFCWDSSSDQINIPHTFDCSATWCTVCNTRGVTQIYGLPAIWPAMFMGSGSLHSSYTISGPVFGYENCTCCYSAQNVNIANGGCTWNAANGYQQIPAVGGYSRYACNNTDACGGDSGGMGMICVSWNCN